MTNLPGFQNKALHHPDGSHRTTPPTTTGHLLENHEARIRRHLAAHALVGENVKARVEELFARDGIALAEATPEGDGVIAVMFVRPGGEHFQRFGYATSASNTAQIGRAAFLMLLDAARTTNQVSHLQWVPYYLGHPAHYGASDPQAAFESFNAVMLSYETVTDWDETEARAQFIEAMTHATILRNLLGDDLYAEYCATEID